VPVEHPSMDAGSMETAETFTEFPQVALERSIPDRFAAMVRRHADRPALVAPSETLTYGALDRAADRVARGVLARRGPGQEPIALLLQRDAPLVAAILGVLKAGKICVPLDPAFPEERLRAVVENAQPALLLVDPATAALAARLAPDPLPALHLAELEADPSTEPAGPAVPPDALACITYTSGSTGRPKGVLQNHRNLLHDVMVRTNVLQVRAADRLTGLYPLAFSAGFKSGLLALLNGAAFCLYDPQAQGLHSLAAWMARERITIYDSVATTFRHFAGALAGTEQFPAIRTLWIGAEQVTAHDIALYRRHFPVGTSLIIKLSGGETGVIRQLCIDRNFTVGEDFADVGYAVPDKEVLLLDEEGRPVPADGVGEIVVRSRYLALGYWRRPDLTRAAFQPDPAGTEARLFRTGDLGRLRPDGCLEYLGRKDFQAKVRGQRVDLGALEHALLAVDGVQEAAVIVREDRQGDQRLVAYVVPAHRPGPAVQTLRQAVAARSPSGPIPAVFVVLDGLPRTPNGKVDRRALPPPDPGRDPAEVVAPRDAVEATLVGLWEDLLGVRPVGVGDEFFALGGHSLLAARLFAEIATRFGQQLPMATLFRAPTVARLAAVLRGEVPAGAESSLVPITAGGSKPPLFCFHQHTGQLFCYLALARCLGADQPVFGLVPRALDGRSVPLDRIEALGAAYLQEILRVQPRGPYYLAGYCFGGTVAFEVAQQLSAQGERVALVALLEAAWEGGGGRTLRRLARRLAFEWAELGRRRGPARLGYALARALNVGQEQAALLRQAAAGVRLRRRVPETYLERAIRRVEAAHAEAVRHYAPRVYPGRITLFRGAELPGRFPRVPSMGWAGLAAGGITVEEVPGRYRTLVEDAPARLVAERLAHHLAAASAG